MVQLINVDRDMQLCQVNTTKAGTSAIGYQMCVCCNTCLSFMKELI